MVEIIAQFQNFIYIVYEVVGTQDFPYRKERYKYGIKEES